MKKNLSNVTLIGIDCVDLARIKIARDICEKDFSFGSVKILSSITDSDPEVISIKPIKSTEEYSEFCIKELWKYVDTEFALIFQYDGFILNPLAWDEKFLDYDYIGAPWYHMSRPGVGNGGFSIRSRKLLKYISENYQEIGGAYHPEDIWICENAKTYIEKSNMKFAPLELASRFSKEGSIRGSKWNEEFGWHGIRYTDISTWVEKNPEYERFFKDKVTDGFAKFMRKYPIYDGTFHVFQTKKIQLENYKNLSENKKEYDCRIEYDFKYLDEIKSGHKIIYNLFRITPKKAEAVQTFEKTVEKVDYFSSKKELLRKYPDIGITPSFNLPKWRQKLVRVFGNLAFPQNKTYAVFWFD